MVAIYIWTSEMSSQCPCDQDLRSVNLELNVI